METKTTVAAMSVQFARKMIESARKNGVVEINGKKEVTVNGNKFYVWTEPFTKKDGKVMNRPHIEDVDGKDISKRFKVRQDLYAIVKACNTGKTESKRHKKPMDVELYNNILKAMESDKNGWTVSGDVVSKEIEGIGLVEILGEYYEQNGKKMLNRMVKVNGELKIGGMNARNIYLRANTIKKKHNKKSMSEIDTENEDYFSKLMGEGNSVQIVESGAV